MAHLWDGLYAAYRRLGFERAAGVMRCSGIWCWQDHRTDQQGRFAAGARRDRCGHGVLSHSDSGPCGCSPHQPLPGAVEDLRSPGRLGRPRWFSTMSPPCTSRRQGRRVPRTRLLERTAPEPQITIGLLTDATVRGHVKSPLVAGKSPHALAGVEVSSGRSPRLCWAWRMRNDSPSGDDDGGVVKQAKARGFADSRWWKSRNLHVLGHFAVECGASSRTC